MRGGGGDDDRRRSGSGDRWLWREGSAGLGRGRCGGCLLGLWLRRSGGEGGRCRGV